MMLFLNMGVNIFNSKKKKQQDAVDKRLKELGISPPQVNIERPSRNASSKFKNKYRKYKTPIKVSLIIICFLGLVTFVIYLLNITSITTITDISVVEYSGGDFTNIEPDRLESALSKKYNKAPFFETKSTELKSEITTLSPYIENAYVEKLFPSSIKISIVERIPIATLKNKTSCYTFDRDRVVVELNEELDGKGCQTRSDELNTLYIEADTFLAKSTLNSKIPFYDIENILLTREILAEFGYGLDKVILEQDDYIFKIDDKSSVIESRQEALELQNKRLIIVLKEVEGKALRFKKLDVRYERPVIKQ